MIKYCQKVIEINSMVPIKLSFHFNKLCIKIYAFLRILLGTTKEGSDAEKSFVDSLFVFPQIHIYYLLTLSLIILPLILSWIDQKYEMN